MRKELILEVTDHPEAAAILAITPEQNKELSQFIRMEGPKLLTYLAEVSVPYADDDRIRTLVCLELLAAALHNLTVLSINHKEHQIIAMSRMVIKLVEVIEDLKREAN